MKIIKKRLLPIIFVLAMCFGNAITAQAAGPAVALIPPGVYCYDYSSGVEFSEGLMAVQDMKTYKWGYINVAGQLVIPCQYETAYPFSDGVARVVIGYSPKITFAFIDMTGRVLFSYIFDSEEFEPDYYAEFHEGLIKVQSSSNGKYGFMNMAGQLVVPCQYGEAKEFSDGLSAVYDSANNYWGYVDAAGNVVLPFRYNSAESFVGGYALVQGADNSGRWMLIDKAGRNVIPTGYEYIYEEWNNFATNGGVVWIRQNSSYYLLNQTGAVTGPIKGLEGDIYNAFQFSEGLTWVRDGYSPFCINVAGQKIFRHDSVREGKDFSNGYAVVHMDSWDYSDKSGFIDSNGRLTMFPEGVMPTESEKFSNGLLPVYSYATGTKRYGFVNTAGQVAIPCTYADDEPFYGGAAPVMNFEGKWGLVNADGAQVLPIQYSSVASVEGAHGLFLASDDNGAYLIAVPAN